MDRRESFGGKVVNVFDWIERELAPTRCNSETFFYDEEAIRSFTVETRICPLTHPSGRTLAAWMREIGFCEVQPTHGGAWFAGRLFEHLPVGSRPTDLGGVDALLRPLVEVVVQMAAPVDADPPITAVK
jgi:hypothetical protein